MRTNFFIFIAGNKGNIGAWGFYFFLIGSLFSKVLTYDARTIIWEYTKLRET